MLKTFYNGKFYRLTIALVSFCCDPFCGLISPARECDDEFFVYLFVCMFVCSSVFLFVRLISHLSFIFFFS